MFRLDFARDRYDAVVIGGRCAGAATAMLLARGGAKVLMIDREARGADTLSTHALMRPAVVQLQRWGVLPALIAAGTPAAKRITFRYGDEAIPVDVKPRDGVEGLYAPRRRLLDRVLVDAAAAAGVEIRFGASLEAVKTDGAGRVRGAHLRDRSGRYATVRANIVIGADGRNSTLAAQVGAEVYARAEQRTATVYGYFAGVENTGFQWHYQPGFAAGALPTNDGLHCVFAGVRPERYKELFGADPLAGLMRLLAKTDPALAQAFYAAGPQDGIKRFPGAPGHLRQSHGPGWALVGDAGYFKDPVTAHGITDALLDAERLAAAVLRGGDAALAQYQAERDRFARPLLSLTDQVAALDWDLEQIKRLHGELSACMKAESIHAPLASKPANGGRSPMAA